MSASPLVSTIVPVLNDAAALKRCLSAMIPDNSNQIIVADGGADESCRALAAEFGAEYIQAPCGRARQMNRAVELARGKWFWFLHADCTPAPDSVRALCDLDETIVWGCFRHRIDADAIWLRVIERADNIRARLGMPYGDQGIFVRADVFRALSGFDDVPLLEDVMLARKLGAMSSPRVLKPVLRSDARRWMRNGIGRTTFRNWRIMFEFLVMGKTAGELARLYR